MQCHLPGRTSSEHPNKRGWWRFHPRASSLRRYEDVQLPINVFIDRAVLRKAAKLTRQPLDAVLREIRSTPASIFHQQEQHRSRERRLPR